MFDGRFQGYACKYIIIYIVHIYIVNSFKYIHTYIHTYIYIYIVYIYI